MRRCIEGALILAIAAVPASPAALAQSRPGPAQVERNAIELKQGMTLEAVRKLLGKPKRTALRTGNATAVAPWQGALQWTYTFDGSGSNRVLQVVFAAKTPEQWTVESWDWPSY